jgi:hypothetical protein
LEYITANGGVITDAVSSQDWPGEASVHVSLVNWTKAPTSAPMTFALDGEPVDGITPELRTPGHSTGVVANLKANKGRCFQGPIPVGDGFIINREAYRRNWWQFAEPRRALRVAVDRLTRYIAGVAQGKRLLFAWFRRDSR